MNTVMDDNRMLTLASNERIPLTPTMRLLLEINHMNHCSPATVSRGGVIYVNATDIGWKPVSCVTLSPNFQSLNPKEGLFCPLAASCKTPRKRHAIYVNATDIGWKPVSCVIVNRKPSILNLNP